MLMVKICKLLKKEKEMKAMISRIYVMDSFIVIFSLLLIVCLEISLEMGVVVMQSCGPSISLFGIT